MKHEGMANEKLQGRQMKGRRDGKMRSPIAWHESLALVTSLADNDALSIGGNERLTPAKTTIRAIGAMAGNGAVRVFQRSRGESGSGASYYYGADHNQPEFGAARYGMRHLSIRLCRLVKINLSHPL
jgi:hypothetical protein